MITAAASGNGGSAALGIVVWVIIIVAYWVPSIVAAVRKAPSTGSIVVVNLFLGWTVVGWIVALAMACRTVPRPQQYAPPADIS